MKPLTAQELLTVWERGRRQMPARRALMLLSAALESEAADRLKAITVGERDARLLQLRCGLFGSAMAACAQCEHCGQSLEFSLDATQIAQTFVPASSAASAQIDDYEIEYALPTAGDLAELSTSGSATEAREALLSRCVRSVTHHARALTWADLGESILDRLGDLMRQADPLAEIQLSLTCSHCGKTAKPLFDIVTYLCREIDVWAARIVDEVHAIAREYGWTEETILNLSPERRQLYMERIGA